jgi:hypothetical protein
MAKKKKKRINLLTKKQEKQLRKMAEEMLNIAANVVEEYEGAFEDLDDLSELSGSITQINENSPYLDEIFEGDSWKKVIKNVSPLITKQKKDKEDDTE